MLFYFLFLEDWEKPLFVNQHSWCAFYKVYKILHHGCLLSKILVTRVSQSVWGKMLVATWISYWPSHCWELYTITIDFPLNIAMLFWLEYRTPVSVILRDVLQRQVRSDWFHTQCLIKYTHIYVYVYIWWKAPVTISVQRIEHDDVMKWKHFPRYWPFGRGINRSLVDSPHKGQWRGALMFSLICVWINGWVNNREAGDLRRQRAHYDVIVMIRVQVITKINRIHGEKFDASHGY